MGREVVKASDHHLDIDIGSWPKGCRRVLRHDAKRSGSHEAYMDGANGIEKVYRHGNRGYPFGYGPIAFHESLKLTQG